jgi:hypothetical protein
MANGTTTVPTILAGETGFLMTMSWIDENEAEYTSSLIVKSAVNATELQAIVDTAQLASNASLYRVELTTQWEGAKSATNALSAVHESVADKLRYSLKAVATKGYTHAYIPAPLKVLIGDNGIVDTSQTIYINWRDDIDDIKLAAFTPLNVGFVQYSQRNDSTSP